MRNKFLQFLSMTKKAGKLVEGYNKSEEAIKGNKGYLVLLSTELSENSKKKFHKYCDDRTIPYIDSYSNRDLGEVIGKSEINVLCVTDEGMGRQLVVLNGTVDNNRG
jgi:Ribosomal protein HS6-type (S12/L30/L7a)